MVQTKQNGLSGLCSTGSVAMVRQDAKRMIEHAFSVIDGNESDTSNIRRIRPEFVLPE